MSANATRPSSNRRYDLDVLRVAAFGLLIFYHVGMFYVPWDWHVKSTHVVPQLEPLMLLLNPWRLSLLFVISGAATRFMGEKMTAGALARGRSSRLLIPLMFGMLVIVAPQSWAQVQEQFGYTGSFLAFWPRYLTFDHSFKGLILPTYNHLWFVIYLWVYTMAAAALWPLLPRLQGAFDRLFSGARLWLIPIALFTAFGLLVEPHHPETHLVWADPYAHLQYGTAFAMGLMLARCDAAWALMNRRRWVSAAVAVLAYAAMIAWRGDADLPLAALGAVGREVYAWAAICALFGFANRHVVSGGPRLTMLTEAVFPFYLVHQTVIVVVGHLISPYRLPTPLEAAILIASTVVGCVAAYLLARSVPALGPLFGLKAAARKPSIRSALPATDMAAG